MSLLKFRLILIIQFVFAINAFAQLNVNTYLIEARADITNKKYFEAIQKLDICIEVYPSEYAAYFYRGVCKYYLKDNLGAVQDLNGAISMYNPLLYDAYHYRGLVRYRLGDYEGAIKDINHVIDGAGNDPVLLVERAFFKLSAQNYHGAISDCTAALRMKYMSENLYLCMGMGENAINKFDSALICYNLALKINPQSEDIYVRIGMTDADLGKYLEAIEQYNHALKIDSTNTLAYFNRAEANSKLNNDNEALEDYNMVINYDPTNAVAYFDRGIIEANKKEYRVAIADFDKVLTLNPKNIQALVNRANLKYETKDYQGAIKDYNTTLELFPYFVEAYNDRARVKESLHDYAGAKSDYILANYMAEANRFRDTIQKANDSTRLTHLLALNSNFNSVDKKLADTASIDLMPIYKIASKDNNYGKPGYFPFLFKKDKQEYNIFCLTNKKIQYPDTAKDNTKSSINQAAKDKNGQLELALQKAIQKTNMQLFNAAGKDYDKIIEQDTGCAIAYFARGIDICEETEALSQLDDNTQYTYINKTYKVGNDPTEDKYKKALADFSKTIQIEPDFAFAYYNRAYVKYKLHDLSGAVGDYNIAIQINADFADAYYNRGLLLFCENNKLDACEDFSKAGELGITEAYVIIKLYCSEVTK